LKDVCSTSQNILSRVFWDQGPNDMTVTRGSGLWVDDVVIIARMGTMLLADALGSKDPCDRMPLIRMANPVEFVLY
jgi:hypothetical protein